MYWKGERQPWGGGTQLETEEGHSCREWEGTLWPSEGRAGGVKEHPYLWHDYSLSHHIWKPLGVPSGEEGEALRETYIWPGGQPLAFWGSQMEGPGAHWVLVACLAWLPHAPGHFHSLSEHPPCTRQHLLSNRGDGIVWCRAEPCLPAEETANSKINQ